jgi:serine/threonine protein kinase
MAASLVLADGNPGPVNEGERRVLRQLLDRLPDDFEIFPNLQIAVANAKPVEVDALVLGPDCVWLVEVKDLAGTVHFGEHQFSVNGEPRSHPLATTRLKAQKIKDRLVVNPALGDIWIQPLIILARAPRRLELAEPMRPYVVVIERAVQVLCDPTLIGLQRNRLSEHARSLLKARLAVDARSRPARTRFGEYQAIEMLASGGGSEWWKAQHHLLGNEVLLEVQAYDPLSGGSTAAELNAKRLRPVRVGQLLGAHPNLLSPLTAFIGDDGALVVVHPMSPHPTLESLNVDELDDGKKRKIVHGVALLLEHCRRVGVAHRTIGPSWIHVGPNGETRLGGFGVAKLPLTTEVTVTPADWSIFGDFWAAPEHVGGEVGHEADLFALGKLIRHLWATDSPSALDAVATQLMAPRPADRGPAALEVARIARGNPGIESPAQRGLTLANRYVLERKLGEGATASVWAATDALTGSAVAVKIFESADAGEQVQREYTALQALSHEAIVRVRDITRIDEKWVLLTELLEGPNLRAYLLDQGKLPVDAAVQIVLRLLSGLKSIHPDVDSIRAMDGEEDADGELAERRAELQSSGIVHRDVKPENVILMEGRGPVLVDFGHSAGTGGGIPGGTLAYRPPDVAADGVDPDVDLFAVGVILHELLTGKHPYAERNPLIGEFEPSKSVPNELAPVVHRACSPLRSERFSSATEFIGALIALGIPETEIPLPQVGIVERLRAIEDALVAQRWGEAIALCDPDWVTVIGRIDRRRNLAESAGTSTPLLEIYGFSLSLATVGGFSSAVDPGNVERGPGQVGTYLVDGPAGELLEVLQYRAGDGTIWVQGGDTFQTPMPLQRIGRALRLGTQLLDENVMMELRMARITDGDGWSNMYQVSLGELEQTTGTDVCEILRTFGAIAVGTRSEILDDQGPRRNTLCVLGSRQAEHLPVVAHFLTRVLPLARSRSATL